MAVLSWLWRLSKNSEEASTNRKQLKHSSCWVVDNYYQTRFRTCSPRNIYLIAPSLSIPYAICTESKLFSMSHPKHVIPVSYTHKLHFPCKRAGSPDYTEECRYLTEWELSRCSLLEKYVYKSVQDKSLSSRPQKSASFLCFGWMVSRASTIKRWSTDALFRGNKAHGILKGNLPYALVFGRSNCGQIQKILFSL